MSTEIVTNNAPVSEHFIDLELLAPKLGLTNLKWARETVRNLINDGIVGPDEFRRETLPKLGAEGRPQIAYFLSPLGAMALAMHTRTPKAAAWRHNQRTKLIPPPQTIMVDIGALAEAVAERVIAKLPKRRRNQKIPKPAPRLPTNEERILTWLNTLPIESEITVVDVAHESEMMLDPGVARKIGIILGRAGWIAVRRVRREEGQIRVYCKRQ